MELIFFLNNKFVIAAMLAENIMCFPWNESTTSGAGWCLCIPSPWSCTQMHDGLSQMLMDSVRQVP